MKLARLDTVTPGDKLAMPIKTPDGKVMLSAGTVLNENYIDKIANWKVDYIYVVDDRFNDIELIEPLDLKIKNNALNVLREIYCKVHNDKDFDEFQLKDISEDMVEYARDNKEKGVAILCDDVSEDYLIEHSLNVALLTAFMGNRMNFNYSQLCDLVTGALIHDMGRTDSKDEDVHHVKVGFDIMRRHRGLSLYSSIVCFEHHENFDGSGYPRKLNGTAISEFTRVIKVADMYDELLHNRGGDPLMPHQAYEHILAYSGSTLDPEMVQKFRDTIIFYPNACTVLLSNNLKGIVIKQNLGAPQRPVVRLFNSMGNIMGDIDLSKNLTIYVKEVITA